MTMADATILVVDDEPALVEIFSLWIKRLGATVVNAPNGAEALKILSTRKIDVLVSDMRMPIMDGLDLVRGIHERNLAVPSIIFVSGFSDTTPRVLYSLGVEAMLPKPLARLQLLDTVNASLRDREELWLTQLSPLPEQSLTLDFPSLEDAIATQQFSLGRGGFCTRSPDYPAETPVTLHLRFAAEGLSLEGSGIVRWYDPAAQHAGIEFTYLAPNSRAWVLSRINASETQSFIPFC